MFSTWWLIVAFFAGVGVASFLFALMQVSGYLPHSVQTQELEL